MTLEQLFQDLTQATGSTPRTVRKPGERPLKRVEVPTVIWQPLGMRCWVESGRFNKTEEELFVRIYRDDQGERYGMTLWFANLSEHPAYEGHEGNKTMMEYFLGREPRVRMICRNLLQSRRTNYEEIVGFWRKKEEQKQNTEQ